MMEQWKTLSARFAALQLREKYLIGAAALVVILLGGYNVWIDPALIRKAAAEKQIAQYRADMTTLGAQVAAMQAQLKDPDAASRAAIAESRQHLAELDRQLSGLGKELVPSEKMALLLQALLSRHRGLELVSLHTLPPLPIIPAQADKASVKPGDPAKAAASEPGNIYKHGIEIKLAGGYQDLLNYLGEMESSPQRLLLGRMNLEVTRYPRVELTVTVYTLSLDRTWLVI
ncbi:MSHA biogenesis protein MshJ [Georgfuchsia toluolica]|uniref:MSHA biogenesis protein MshJ n=1 Tax=Georgfuchsia toluolica TaxID=424218 RepID=A0A916J776_9PROT|nr:type II secretion system protein GspM [Georgfuchsia toluolica]CAG4885202.1 MSHA biogenesis protein MshJ [Georgfuchsia toluolica]